MSEPANCYPPNPPQVPKDLTEPNWSYCTRVLLVLASLVVFIALYIGLVVGSAYVCYSSFQSLKGSGTYMLEQPRQAKDRSAAVPRFVNPNYSCPLSSTSC